MSLLELCGLVFTYNAMTFGNGPAMVPLLQGGLVERRGVLGADQLLYAFTITRVTPGQANTYVAAVGYLLHGLVGAPACTAAILLPGYLMLPLLWGYRRFGAARLVPAFTRGLTVASAEDQGATQHLFPVGPLVGAGGAGTGGPARRRRHRPRRGRRRGAPGGAR